MIDNTPPLKFYKNIISSIHIQYIGVKIEKTARIIAKLRIF